MEIDPPASSAPPPLEDQLQKLLRDKKKRREYKKLVPEGWETGKPQIRKVSAPKPDDKDRSDSDSSDDEKGKGKRKHKGLVAVKEEPSDGSEAINASPMFFGAKSSIMRIAPDAPSSSSSSSSPVDKNNHKAPSAEFMTNFGPQNIAELPRKRQKLTPDEISKMGTQPLSDNTRASDNANDLFVVPMDQYYSSFYHSKGKSTDEAAEDLSNSLTKSIDKKIRLGNDVSKKEQRKTTAKNARINQEREQEKAEFFKNDADPLSPFGRSPADYFIFKVIEADFMEREKRRSTARDAVALGTIDPDGKEFDMLPELSVAYCNEFLREARSEDEFLERPCVQGDKCVSVLMARSFPDTIEEGFSEDAFVCRELLLPHQRELVEKERKLPEKRQRCLLDNLALITYAHFFHLQEHSSPKEVLQNFRNPMGGIGGYPSEICIYPTPGNKQYTGIVRPIRVWSQLGYRPGTVRLPKYHKSLKCWKDDYTVPGF